MARSSRATSVKRMNPQPKTNGIWTAIWHSLGLPEPTLEYRFDAKRRWRFDYAWPAQKVALEVEGGVFTRGRHTRGAGFLKDIDKYNAATLAGWKVLRVTPKELLTKGPALLKAALL